MKVVTMAMNAAASAFSNCAPQKATSPDLMGNTRPRRKPRDYASGGENRWGRRVPHRATASHAATLALLLLAGCMSPAEQRAVSIDECRSTCAPHGWALSTWNGGCTCHGLGATDAGVSR